jgi:hypothetical protein
MSWLEWLISQLRPGQPGFWLLVDALSAALLWWLKGVLSPRRVDLARVVRWIGLPWLALMAGALSPELLGLSHLDWRTGLTFGVLYSAAVLGLLALIAVTMRSERQSVAQEASGATIFYAVLFHGARQLHWCFLRALMLIMFTSLPVPVASAEYWAILAATALALPGVWMTEDPLGRTFGLLALAATAILFFYTGNFWLCWALHVGIMFLSGTAVQSLPAGTRAPADGELHRQP